MSKQCALTLLTAFAICVSAASAQKIDSGFIKHSSTMAERWELEDQYHKGFFLVTPYKPTYVTAGRKSNNPNVQPMSENPAYSQTERINYNKYEAKFQFSLKTKVARKIFWKHGDLWVAYTQKAHWQIYNKELSRPFRELNYEPEIILNFPTNYSIGGLKGRMIGVSFNHQSNGRELPLSRSWNRIIFHAGFENKHWQLLLRPWIRLHDEEDENPAITDFTGRGEAVVVYNFKRYQFSSVMTHSLRFENGGRGSIQLNLVFPVINNLRGMVQFTDGYGETLQDYNHRQTTVGLSVALVDW
jgi:phospholipase A1/A2